MLPSASNSISMRHVVVEIRTFFELQKQCMSPPLACDSKSSDSFLFCFSFPQDTKVPCAFNFFKNQEELQEIKNTITGIIKNNHKESYKKLYILKKKCINTNYN